MDDYIKREDALDIVADNNVTGEITLNRYDKIIDGIYEIPPADVAPVVRCKDCKYWDEHSQYGYDDERGTYGNYCMIWTPDDDFYAVETPEDGFCYNGERKDDE